MNKQPIFNSPDAYVRSVAQAWHGPRVQALRALALGTPGLQERLKWGHLVYFCQGPVLLIRAEPARLLFGFWRGRLLRHIEPRLKPGGKYDLATLELRESTPLERGVAVALMREAVALNRGRGDPTAA